MKGILMSTVVGCYCEKNHFREEIYSIIVT